MIFKKFKKVLWGAIGNFGSTDARTDRVTFRDRPTPLKRCYNELRFIQFVSYLINNLLVRLREALVSSTDGETSAEFEAMIKQVSEVIERFLSN